ncbi:hypothetical protein FHS19_001723 [Paenibacillus rhizosphaerae]|uniref:Uncharacterized protein n=1 Tax=Paenibacillus rhizosphaerae TaxID=297318 RepID=A0A839TNY1_9BACL|nr:hypothetical protein [Paenibacillus rhizosphaerae]MBB3127069.1 hypothetical protein [Paenibacillus rhizosphaerae]
MALLKNSPELEEIKEQYHQLWNSFLEREDEQVRGILTRAEFELMSEKGKLLHALRPFKTHLLWIIPISVIVVILVLYFLFLWVSLLVE